MIRPVLIDDAEQIAEIYNYYVTNSIITFEEETVSADEYVNRITDTISNGFPWLVWETDGAIAGYAYAGKWRQRIAYRFTVETAVYLDQGQLGNGIGSQLYAALLDELRKGDFRVVMGWVALPNEESVKLHERFGFKKVAHFPEVGWKFNRWIDVGGWQLMLNSDE